MRRHKEVTASGLQFVDVALGRSVGLKEGYSMMIGGDKEPVEYLRLSLRRWRQRPIRMGARWSGGVRPLVKMIHNGIEYGMMQAYAEGFTIWRRKRRWT